MEKTTRWQLADKCIFVDAYDFNTEIKGPKKHPRIPKEYDFAHIIWNVTDHEKNWKFIKLGDEAGFIMRYVAMGVDTDTELPEILKSEFSNIEGLSPAERVNEVVTNINSTLRDSNGNFVKILVPRVKQETNGIRTLEVIENKGKYKLKFDVESYGGGVIKIVR